MPRQKIELSLKLESLSVLGPDGSLDAALEPKIPDADLRKIYKTMLHSRMLDERCLMMQRQGRIGTYGPCKGQEATPVAFSYWMKKDDWLVPTYRELAAFLWRGWPMDRYMLWWGGNEIGSSIAEGINDLPICVPIASQCQYAMGIAWGAKMRKNGQVVVCFCGDGGTSEGDFHEAMNYAGVFKVPLIMVVQNNQWAISVPRHKQTASQTIAQKAIAYGMNAIQIDGNDVLAGLAAAKEAFDYTRAGHGPMLIEAVTYRLSMHTTADDPKKYRSDEEVKEWEKKDPLIRFRAYLLKKKLLDDKIEAVMKEEITAELDAAVTGYEKYVGNKYDMFKYMYSEMTPELRKQMAECQQYFDSNTPAGQPVAAH